MMVSVNAQNKRTYKCKKCNEVVNFDGADDLMKEHQFCDRCLNEMLNEEDKT